MEKYQYQTKKRRAWYSSISWASFIIIIILNLSKYFKNFLGFRYNNQMANLTTMTRKIMINIRKSLSLMHFYPSQINNHISWLLSSGMKIILNRIFSVTQRTFQFPLYAFYIQIWSVLTRWTKKDDVSFKMIRNQNCSRKFMFFRAITKIGLNNNSIFHFAHYIQSTPIFQPPTHNIV